MHLIIDIRQNIPENPIILRYATDWVNLWRTKHPGDSVSYLVFAHQSRPKDADVVIVNEYGWWQSKRRIATKDTREIFRSVSFSPLAPYDHHIRTIIHNWDHLNALYPQSDTYWIKYTKAARIQKRIKNAGTIVVPTLSIGQEAVEIHHIDESHIEIIPYINLDRHQCDSHILQTLGILTPYFLYDWTYGAEINITALLQGYRSYLKLGGTKLLVLMGNISREIKSISELIRSFDLTNHVKIIGTPDWRALDTFYSHASGWIYTGAYYAGWPRVALAESYGLPLLLSDIPVFSEYQEWAIYIHPHHLETLGRELQALEAMKPRTIEHNKNTSILAHYEKLLAQAR